MSQARTRKVAVSAVQNGENGPNPHMSAVKANMDSLAKSVRTNQTRKSRSRNKVPKSVRYGLENALIGLCDVWFEDIKPHLIRNNIKLHVQGMGAAPIAGVEAGPATSACAGCASGDYEQQQQQQPPAMPTCSHLDPGAAPDRPRQKTVCYADSYTKQPTASKAPCLKPQPANRQRQPPHPLPQASRMDCAQVQRHNCEKKRTRGLSPIAHTRTKRTPQPRPHSPHRVHCRSRTYNSSPPRYSLPLHTLSPRPLSPSTLDEIYVRELFKTILNRGSVRSPTSPRRRRVTLKNRSTQFEGTGNIVSVASQTSPAHSSLWAPSRHNSRPGLGPSPMRQKSNHTLCREPTYKDSVLFQDDLIDIIAKKHDRRAKHICNKNERKELPSLMNLVSPKDRKKKAGGRKKNVPWR